MAQLRVARKPHSIPLILHMQIYIPRRPGAQHGMIAYPDKYHMDYEVSDSLRVRSNEFA